MAEAREESICGEEEQAMPLQLYRAIGACNSIPVLSSEGDFNQKLRPWKKVTDQCHASTSFASDVDTQQGPDLQRKIRHSIAVNQIKAQEMYKYVQVKREQMEEREAQHQAAVSAMSEDILQLKHKLAEYEESLECCVCLERPVRFAFMPCGHCFCGHSECIASTMIECPTCREGITGKTELFGACAWLADLLEAGGNADGHVLRTGAKFRQESLGKEMDSTQSMEIIKTLKMTEIANVD